MLVNSTRPKAMIAAAHHIYRVRSNAESGGHATRRGEAMLSVRMSLWPLLVWLTVMNTCLGSHRSGAQNDGEPRRPVWPHLLWKRTAGCSSCAMAAASYGAPIPKDTGGAACVFPFTYNGRSYDACTSDGRNDNLWWCATTSSYDKDRQYGYCNFNVLPTRMGHGGGVHCTFPFIFGSKSYNTCTLDGRSDGRWWCSSTGNYNADKRYGFCTHAGIFGVYSPQSKATGPTPGCVFPFTYGKVSYKSCTQAGRDDGKWWCSTTPSYDNDRRWAFCSNKAMMSTAGNGGSANCFFPFIYHDKPVYECTQVGLQGGNLWCSVTPNYDTDRKFGLCGRKGGYSAEPSCAFPFLYKGNTYNDCTQDDRTDGKWWCSTTTNYDTDKKWTVCPILAVIPVTTAKTVPTVVIPITTAQSKIIPGNREADIVFVVDGSSGVTNEDFTLLRQVLARVVSSMDVRAEATRVAVVVVGGVPKASINLNSFSDKAQLVAAIERLSRPGGARHLGHALQFLISDVLRSGKGSRIHQGVPQIVYVIMGGKPEDDVTTAVGQLRTMSVRVSAFGVGYHNSARLSTIATSGSLVRSWANFNALLSDSDSLTGNAIYLSEDQASIVFVVDASSAVTANELQAVGHFIVSLANRLNLGAGRARLGVVLYGATPTALVSPGKLGSAQAVESKLAGGLKLVGGATNTGAALKFALNNMMATEPANVPKSIVLVTWGPSSDDISAVPALLQQYTVSLLAIGVRGANQGQLDVLTSRGGKAFQVASGTLLLQLQGQVLTRTIYMAKDVMTQHAKQGTIEIEEYDYAGANINCGDIDLGGLKNSGFTVTCQKNVAG